MKGIPSPRHIPVMVEEVLRYLAPRSGGVYVDATVGEGGHAELILKASSPDGQLIGLDRDEEAIALSRERLKRFGERVTLLQANFRDLERILDSLGLEEVDGILFDLGVSTHQLERPERGFSFDTDAPLDMRMDRRQRLTAYDIVNSYPKKELYRILRELGEEPHARSIARAIVRRREQGPIRTTGELVEVIRSAVPVRYRFRRGRHFATQTFRALRMAVNQELECLEEAIPQAVHRLRKGGRLVVISFHSLEDRIVKRWFARMASACICPPGVPICVCGHKPEVKLLTRKPLRVSPEEVARNPKARSARLRAVERL